MKRLPDTEYDVMRVIWTNPSPITTTVIMEKLGRERGWAVPALITMLNRLNEKGFIYSERKGKCDTITRLSKSMIIWNL